MAAVLAAAFALRAGFVAYRAVTDPSSREITRGGGEADDQLDYDTTARNIAAGRGFWSSDRGGSLYTSEPAYPLFLAGIYVTIGRNLLVVKLLQALLGVVTCYLLFRWGRDLAGERAGLAAAVLFAVHPSHVYYPAFLLAETLKVFMVLLMAVVVSRALCREDSSTQVLAGLSAGAAAMTRIVVLPYLFVVPVLLAFSRGRSRRALLHPLLFLAAGIVVLLPWSARNYVHTGFLSPVRGDAAQLLVDASDPYSLERLEDRPDFKARRQEKMRKDSLEARREVGDAGFLKGSIRVLGLWWSRFCETPLQSCRLLAARLGEFWKLYPQGGGFAAPAFQSYAFAVNLALFALGLVGAVRSAVPSRARAAMLLLVAVFTTVHLFYHTLPMRYRMPIEPILMLLAGAGLAHLTGWHAPPPPERGVCA